jgi:hypothetical protein
VVAKKRKLVKEKKNKRKGKEIMKKNMKDQSV